MKCFKSISNKVIICCLLLSMLSCSWLEVPDRLDGKVLTDKEGNIYKLKWCKGMGNTWRFQYPVTVIRRDQDTLVEWRYYK